MRRTSWRALLTLVLAVVAMSAATIASAAGPPDGGKNRGHHHGKRGHGHGHGHGHGQQPPATKQPTAFGSGGAAATVDVLATQAAIDMLRRGGNAVDAAVAAAGVLGVTEPFSSGIGGGGFMVIRTPHGKVTTIDHREKAPAAMTSTSFWENGQPLAFNDARFSGLSAGVPGTVAGWDHALKRYGRTSLAKALQAGIKVAREGFVVDQTFFDQTQAVVDYFNDVPSTAEIYLDPDGTPRDVGSVLRNPDMARAYEMIARFGSKGFYSGPIAEAMVKAAQNPPIAAGANHTWRPGLMTEDDLKAYTAPERKPTRISYKGLDVWGMGPPSSGGSTVGEILNILEGYKGLGSDRVEALHRFMEASRYAFADRGRYLGDPDFVDVPLKCLLSDRFAAERRKLITPMAATSPVQPGTCDAGKGADGPDGEGPSTTHLTVADRDGMVVSYTFTIESTGGNGIVVPGWGFLLNNELTDFDYTSPTEVANWPDGGKRPRSSMAPTIITKHGKPFLAVGSPGGSMIITTVSQILLERLELGKSLPEAIAAPRVSQRNTAQSIAEAAFPAAERAALEARGHAFGAPAEIGAATGIEFFGRGKMLAAAEPVRRGAGSAMVVKSKR
ncbi:MAG TPA: gamma-glutamyltransferase [Solirubrobacter sp.]|nr:gamma-glutamyltransferase [Solirubrobacter sp.]